MTLWFLVRVTGRMKLSFVDMGKNTMKKQVLEENQEQNFGHANYYMHARNLIGEIKKFVHRNLESREEV